MRKTPWDGLPRIAVIVLSLIWLAACTVADYSDGVTSFSQAVTAATSLGPTLETAAQQNMQTQNLQNLAQVDPRTVLLPAACDVGATNYTSGACALMVAGKPIDAAGAAPATASLANYAAALAAVVADTTCTKLQSDTTGLSTAVSDIAKAAGPAAAAAAAGPISQIVSAAGCLAIGAEQLRALRAATSAANPSIQSVVPLIANAYTNLYLEALDVTHNQAMRSLVAYDTAMARYKQSRSQSDLAAAQSSLTQTIAFASAIDKAKSAPPGPVVTKIATLHAELTNDLNSPVVNLKNVSADAQAFISQITPVVTAAQTLAKSSKPAAAAK